MLKAGAHKVAGMQNEMNRDQDARDGEKMCK